MTIEELSDEFSILGRSTKRELRREFDRNPSGNRTIIGEFGVGLLSALAVADKVQVRSFSTKTPGHGLLWTYERGTDKQPTVDEILGQDYGTTVTVKLSLSYHSKFEPTRVLNAAREFGALLPIPVKVDGNRINPDLHLWNNPERGSETDWQGYVEKREGSRPLLVFRLNAHEANLDLSGILFIPRRRRLVAQGQLSVYIRRMFVCKEQEGLLPRWALPFTSGYINATSLQRTVSGESVARDDAYERCAEFLAGKISEMLSKFADEGRQDFWDLVSQYDGDIKRGAIGSNLFWRSVREKLLFRAGDKMLTIPEYLALVRQARGPENTVFYYKDEADHAQATVIATSTGTPIINAVYGVDALCLKSWEQDFAIEDPSFKEASEDEVVPSGKAHRRLATLGELAREKFDKVKDDRWEYIADCYRELKIGAEVRSFEPKDIPAVLVRTEGFQENLARLEELLGDRREFHDDFFRELLRSAKSGINPGTRLFVNAQNAQMQMVADLPHRSPLLGPILLSVYNNAFMFTHRSLTEEEVSKIFKTNNQVLELLLENRSLSAVAAPPDSIERLGDAVVIVMDIVKSTWLLALTQIEKHGWLFSGFIKCVQEIVRKLGGTVVKFTGDGALIYIAVEQDQKEASSRAIQCARELAIQTPAYFTQKNVRQVLKENSLEIPGVRVALSGGTVFFVSMLGTGDVIGRPVVQAFRLCGTKEFYSPSQRICSTLQPVRWAELGPNEFTFSGQKLDYEGHPAAEVVHI